MGDLEPIDAVHLELPTLYIEVDGVPYEILLNAHQSSLLGQALNIMGNIAPIVLSRLKEGTKIERYEEAPAVH